MMKKIIIVISILVTLIIVLLVVKNVSFGTKESMQGASIVTLEVPKLARVKSECCNYSTTFTCISSVSIIEKELEKIMNKYTLISCDGKTYYYDFFQDITITEYGVEKGFLFNTIYINYSRGNYCNS